MNENCCQVVGGTGGGGGRFSLVSVANHVKFANFKGYLIALTLCPTQSVSGVGAISITLQRSKIIGGIDLRYSSSVG